MAQEKWLINGPKVIDVESVRKLKVGLIAGQVNIIGHDEPTARIDVHSVTGRDLLVTIDGDTMEIDHPQLRWDNFIDAFKTFGGKARADLTVTVPRDVALKFGAVSSATLISGLTEDASISTVSGDVIVDNIYGDLQLNSVSGELSVRNHYGKINGHSISGDITAQGTIMGFTADTVSGEIFLDITGTPDQIGANTVSGNVTVRVESGVAAQYKINSVSGRLQLDNSEITGLRGGYTGRYGELDKHWLELKVNTVSGNISVLHKVDA